MPRFAFKVLALNCVATALAVSLSAADIQPQAPVVQEAVTISADGNIERVSSGQPAPEKLDVSGGPAPQWIWAPGNPQKCFLKTEFEAGEIRSAVLAATCDNTMKLSLNGKVIASSTEWQAPVFQNVTLNVKPGKNVITVEAGDEGGARGFVLKLILTGPDRRTRKYVLSNADWQASATADFANAAPARVVDAYGQGPWGKIFENPGGGSPTIQGKVPAGVFQVQPGFQVELLYTVPKDEQGSWVCLTRDSKGRLIASDQGDKGLFRITPAPIGGDGETKVERLDVKMTAAQGMLDAFGALYCSVNGGPGSGLYRLTDNNGDDQYDQVDKLRDFRGGGEHGPHALRLSPDGKSLYVIAGNHTQPPFEQTRTPGPQTMGGIRPEPIRATLPAGVTSRIPANWDEDLLLPRQWDANGHAAGVLAPGGWIAKTDPTGKQWEMISVGYRNPYDMDFSAEGELFAYDADMEWDMGASWYRPTRLCHAVSGSEFGWRSGTGKWPTWYVDSLPPVVDIGPGSPVGVTFGTGAKFPAKYQRAVYLLDWTFGTIFAVHLQPQGASFVGVKEEFVGRAPLPLTDAVVGADGALYFTIGGRGTQSALYRVTYNGQESTAPAPLEKDQFSDLRALRRRIEELHVAGQSSAANVEFLWPFLSHEDRFIRYAARVALEFQDVALWQPALLKETNAEALITGSVAFAHQGEPAGQAALLARLAALDFAKLSTDQKLELLRAYQLLFIRLGQPSAASTALVLKQLDAAFPVKINSVDRDLCIVLVALNSPTIINKTLTLMNPAEAASEKAMDAAIEVLARNQGYGATAARVLANQPNLQQMHYAFTLRNMRFGWTLEQRQQYFAWFDEAAKRSGGNSYQGFLKNMRNDALANASEKERKALEGLINTAPVKEAELPKPHGPGREWTMDEVLALAETGLTGRSYEGGQRAFKASRCISCHRFDGEGGSTGPDLTNTAGRFSRKDLLESIMDPSKVISDQYRASLIELKSGKVINGRVLSDVDGKLMVLTDPVDHTKIEAIAKTDIEEMQPSPTSLMPAKLLSPLNQEEVLDLLAYLLSRGNPEDPAFQKK